jgi:hypothetical protein
MTKLINIDEEWENFITRNEEEEYDIELSDNKNKKRVFPNQEILGDAPQSSEIYISTKTKIAYLNQEINLKKVFWDIPVIPYAKPCDGVIKKQMKFNSLAVEELDEIKENLKKENHYDEYVMTSINNPNGRIKFKDIRKVTVGISKKDIMSYRSKKKSAFYNCFVIILRIKMNDVFREFHVKIFNTGKLELPGIQTDQMFYTILDHVINTLQPFVTEKLEYKSSHNETVLINSNFNCGFYINREVLYDILKTKYSIHSIYDPCCSYPGIQCKFYYNPSLGIQTGIQQNEEDRQIKNDAVEEKSVSFQN